MGIESPYSRRGVRALRQVQTSPGRLELGTWKLNFNGPSKGKLGKPRSGRVIDDACIGFRIFLDIYYLSISKLVIFGILARTYFCQVACEESSYCQVGYIRVVLCFAEVLFLSSVSIFVTDSL
jgi:hypothetical protein